MQLIIRQPTIDELPRLGDLCFRSKAAWGYDDKFMEACRDELSFGPDDFNTTQIAIAECRDGLVGVAQIKITETDANLLKLFVEPAILRSGIGKALFGWAREEASKRGATRLFVDADPYAAPFYRSMGAHDIGVVPSDSIPGRLLPKLVFNLRE